MTRLYKTWTKKEDAFLMDCAKEKLPQKDAAELLGRTERAVSMRLHTLRKLRGEARKHSKRKVKRVAVQKKPEQKTLELARPEAKPVMTAEQEKEALRKLDERKAAKVAVFQKEPVTELMQEVALAKRDINRIDSHVAVLYDEVKLYKFATFAFAALLVMHTVGIVYLINR